MNRLRLSLILMTVLLWGLALAGCDREAPRVIDLDRRIPESELVERQHPEGLHIGIGSIITPREGYIYYQELLQWLEKKLRMPVHAVDPGSYARLNSLIGSGKVQAAFVCGGPYISVHEKFGAELLLAPVVGGSQNYRSYLVVAKDNPATGYADLRGARFAFTDPDSNSGYLVPAWELKRLGEQPASYFSKTVFTGGHDRSIRAVAAGLVDAAAVDSLIYDYLSATQPNLVAGTRIAARSKPFGIPPLVASSTLAPILKQKLVRLLQAAHTDPEGRQILTGMHIERFAPIDDSAYDGIRRLRAELAAP
ncbi:MAG: phosphate/phosphite/phosphonate ABC transporter substrate-binding protein [Deltaproteobacteria bacterium]|nr:MAG: phosphate/phosphite/phosphonate ABC transporter substrate-binding protein [Deltaproteobacteria bacterium]